MAPGERPLPRLHQRRRFGGSRRVGRRRGRMLGLGLSVVVSSVVAGITPAAGHSCAEPVTVVQGVETQVQVGITVGDLPTGEVTFEFADGFEITEVVRRRGWVVEQEVDVIRFSGGPLDAGACVLFDVPIKARDAGTFRVRAFQRLDDGQVVEHPPDGDVFLDANGSSVAVNHQGPPDPTFEQVIYVTEGADDASGPRLFLLIVTAGAAVGAVALLVPRRNARRPRTR